MSNAIIGSNVTMEVSSIVKLKTLDIEAGNQVRTVSYDDAYETTATPAIGGSLYEITTLALYRIKISDGAWTPDGTKDFYIDNGNIAVDLLADSPATVSIMKTLDLQAGTTVETESYYAYSGSAAAKGGASYQIMTLAEWQALTGLTTPDGYGDHVLTNGLVAQLVVDKSVDVMQTGAKGDGSTNDAAAIQAAFRKHRNVNFVPTSSYYSVSSASYLQFDDCVVDLKGSVIYNDANVASQAAIHINGKNNVLIKNGRMRVNASNGISILNDLPANKITIQQIDFERGAIALTIQTVDADYPAVVNDVNILNCTHDGESLGGGFFSCQNIRGLNIKNCQGKNGSEFFDLNNNCERVHVSGCVSVNYLSNHWDINSTRNATFTGNTVVSEVGSLTSRAIWVSDRTAASDPVGMPAGEKVSHDIVMTNNVFLVDNHDYAEFMIWNSGAQDTPLVQQVYTFSNNIINCGEYYGYTKFPFQGAIATYNISNNTFINCGIEVNCDVGNVNGNTFQYTEASEKAIANVELDNWNGGSFSNNNFINYTATADTAVGGVVIIDDCEDVTLNCNTFRCTTAVAAFFTENGTNARNSYIENRSNVTMSRAGGVRSSQNTNTVIYNGIFARRDTFTASDTTPSVLNCNTWKTANASPTTITNFDNGFDGQQMTVIFNDNNTTIDFTGTALHGNGGVDWAASQYDSMICTYDSSSGRWSCVISG